MINLKKITLSERIAIAKRLTEKATQIKNWKLRRNSDKQLKELAQELNNGKGYIIASAKELTNKYPGLINSHDTSRHVWAIGELATGLQRLAFMPI